MPNWMEKNDLKGLPKRRSRHPFDNTHPVVHHHHHRVVGGRCKPCPKGCHREEMSSELMQMDACPPCKCFKRQVLRKLPQHKKLMKRLMKKAISKGTLTKHAVKRLAKKKKHLSHFAKKVLHNLPKHKNLLKRALKKAIRQKKLPKHVVKKIAQQKTSRRRNKPTPKAHGCGKHIPGSVHCGEKYNSTCINRNAPLKTLKEAWKQCGKVAGCSIIMFWKKDGHYYLRTASDTKKDEPNSGNFYVEYKNCKFK